MYVPELFKRFSRNHPEIAEANQKVGELCSAVGPIDGKERHLVQMGIAIGASAKGAVRSHARRALEAGATKDELIQAVLLSTSIIGFPGMIASYAWVEEMVEAREAE